MLASPFSELLCILSVSTLLKLPYILVDLLNSLTNSITFHCYSCSDILIIYTFFI